ncbi:uncharacterized protein LOC120126657 [Hibiscus syriacus]|uniref:uncharacterized protein LOC120126657 n=1 Tax=Hibiscus syriacus TaxID=106335 RepID=UPI001921B8FD|nr:uncharacterized protein LOC120126657 [Hibiscus syriacus]
MDEGIPPAVEQSVMLMEEVSLPDSENANPNIPHRPGVVVLLETRISGMTADKDIRAFGFQNSFRVEAHGFSGGIWILWKVEIDVEILTISHQFIHDRCWSAEVFRWLYFTAVYASPQVEKRRLVWRHLMNLAPGENEVWIMNSDFNSIIHLDEREGGSSRGSGSGFGSLSSPSVNTVYLENTWNQAVSLYCRLTDHPQFKSLISEAWNKDVDVLTNINSFKSKATEWNLEVFGHIGRKNNELLARLRGIDKALNSIYYRRLEELHSKLKSELE